MYEICGCCSEAQRNYLLNFEDEDFRYHTAGAKVVRCTLVEGVCTIVGGAPLFLVTDLDGTLLGNPDYQREFQLLWLRNFTWREASFLVYNTGRTLSDFLAGARENDLLIPDYAICGVGTEIYYFGENDAESPLDVNSEDITGELLRKGKIKYRVPKYDLLKSDAGREKDMTIGDACVGPTWCRHPKDAHFDREWFDLMDKKFNHTETQDYVESLPGAFYVTGQPIHDPFRLSCTVAIEDLIRISDLGKMNHSFSKNHANADNSVDTSSPISTDGSLSTASSDSLEDMRQEDFTGCFNVFRGWNIAISGTGPYRYLDVLPEGVSKLTGLLHIVKKYGISKSQILVCGDSGNDLDMFADEDIAGIAVSNSQSALLDFLAGEKESFAYKKGLRPTKRFYIAKRECAGGIIDGLTHFGFL